MVYMFVHLCHLRHKEGFVVEKMEQHNLLVAISFNLKFTYVLAGWEGSAHHSLILNNALTRSGGITIPEGIIGKF